ncbi:hairy-related 5 [Menidia menidia]
MLKNEQDSEGVGTMKGLSSPESPRKKTVRRVSKPLMEKRRRERINHSLETLRLLMLENTHNEKLKNPKVEKAEILESVVEFLKTEKGHQTGRSSCPRQHNYREGMRSCLLRVSQFIATKSQEMETAGDAVQASFALPKPQMLPSSPGEVHMSPTAVVDPSAQRRLTQPAGLHGDTGKMFSSGDPTHLTDPVWRPWPQ